jgi:hypothetical protein
MWTLASDVRRSLARSVGFACPRVRSFAQLDAPRFWTPSENNRSSPI